MFSRICDPRGRSVEARGGSCKHARVAQAGGSALQLKTVSQIFARVEKVKPILQTTVQVP